MKLIRPLIVLSLVFLVLPMTRAEKKPFEIEDLYRLKFMKHLAVSPEGEDLLFTLESYDLHGGKKFSDIYRLDLKTKSLKRLTFSDASESGPVWGKDSRYIYFLSSREDGAQLWRMASDGGEAEKISSFSPGISSPVIFADHGAVLFSSSVFPECGPDSGCHDKMSKKLQEGPAQGHHGKSLLFRHWVSYRDWRYSHLFRLDLKKGNVEAVTEGEHDFPTYGGKFALSPAEDEICLAVNFDQDAAVSTNSDLYLIDLKTGEKKNITKSNPAFDGAPAYSPDGRYIAYEMQRVPSFESTNSGSRSMTGKKAFPWY